MRTEAFGQGNRADARVVGLLHLMETQSAVLDKRIVSVGIRSGHSGARGGIGLGGSGDGSSEQRGCPLGEAAVQAAAPSATAVRFYCASRLVCSGYIAGTGWTICANPSQAAVPEK